MSDDAWESDEALAGLVDSLDTALVALDSAGCVRRVNDAAERLLSRSRARLVGQPLMACGAAGEALSAALRVNGEATGHRERVACGAQTWDVEASPWWVGGDRAGTVLAVRAASSDRQGESSIALMAAGLAHEVRNPLAAVRGAAELLGREPGISTNAREYLDLIVKQADRMDALTKRLLDLARPPQLVRVPVPASELVHELALEARALAAQLGANVQVEEAFDPALPPLFLDRARVTDALVNLVKNAVEASPPEGLVRIEARMDLGRRRQGARDVRLVRIVVRDEGPGIEPVRERLFTPFATTKPAGTGLGLLLARREVEAHGGWLSLEQREAPTGAVAGTDAVVLLPIGAVDG